MDLFRRIWVIICSLISIFLSFCVAVAPEECCYLLVVLLALTLFGYGIQQLFYYFTMARFKIGGRINLYISIICLDLGFITMGITEVRPQLVMVYLLLYYIFYGVIRTYSALEAKRMGASSWRTKLVSGIVCLVLCVQCVLNFTSEKAMVYILCFGFAYSALMQLIMACRRTAIIYIQ